MRIEATPKLWELSEPLIGPMIAESQAMIDELSDSEIARFTDFMNRAIEAAGPPHRAGQSAA